MKRLLIVLYLATCFIVGTALATGESTTLQTWINSINTWMTSAKASIASQATSIGALTTRVAATEAMNSVQSNRLTAAEGALAAQAGQIATLQAQVAALSATPTPVPTPVPVPVAALWSASMEMGNLSEWSEQTVSGGALNVAVQAALEGIPARSTWVLKQSVTGAAGGARMQRYPEIDKLARSGTPFWYSFWAYFPGPVSFGIYDMFQIISINSTTPAGSGAPMWGIFVDGTNFTPVLGWSPNGMAPSPGPHVGESGKRFYPSATPIPTGSWVRFELYMKPAADFTGALQLYMNGTLIFDMSAIETMYLIPSAVLVQWIDKDAYGSGLTPTPYSHYVDDVTISLSRMP